MVGWRPESRYTVVFTGMKRKRGINTSDVGLQPLAWLQFLLVWRAHHQTARHRSEGWLGCMAHSEEPPTPFSRVGMWSIKMEVPALHTHAGTAQSRCSGVPHSMLLLSTPIPSREGWALRVRILRNGFLGSSPEHNSQAFFQVGYSRRRGQNKRCTKMYCVR